MSHEKKPYLEAGEIVNTHGVRGEVKIVPWADSAEFLRGFRFFYIGGRAYALRGSYVHKGCLIASLEGIESVEAAMALKGRTVCIDRAEAVLPEGRFFLSDIIGAKVVTDEGAELGTLADVLELPGHNVYVVRGEKETLIPAVPEFILHTDVDGGTVTVHLIEGM